MSINLKSMPQQIEIKLDTMSFKGIFELRGDRLRHCFRKCPLKDSNCSSPTEFATNAGEAVFLTEYVRVVE